MRTNTPATLIFGILNVIDTIGNRSLMLFKVFNCGRVVNENDTAMLLCKVKRTLVSTEVNSKSSRFPSNVFNKNSIANLRSRCSRLS